MVDFGGYREDKFIDPEPQCRTGKQIIGGVSDGEETICQRHGSTVGSDCDRFRGDVEGVFDGIRY
ncbi:hypothetical protein GCM10023319_73810 [Nocardia iowensis]